MKGIFYLVSKIWTFFFTYKSIIPKSFAGIFIVSNFIYNMMNLGINYAFNELSKTLFIAELKINENVTLAIQNSTDYGFMQFIDIIVSFIIIWNITKFIGKLLIKITGSQAEWGAYSFAVLILLIIEISASRVILGDFSFIPIKDGIFFLLLNLQPVLQNIHLFGYNIYTPKAKDILINKINQTVNISSEY